VWWRMWSCRSLEVQEEAGLLATAAANSGGSDGGLRGVDFMVTALCLVGDLLGLSSFVVF